MLALHIYIYIFTLVDIHPPKFHCDPLQDSKGKGLYHVFTGMLPTIVLPLYRSSFWPERFTIRPRDDDTSLTDLATYATTIQLAVCDKQNRKPTKEGNQRSNRSSPKAWADCADFGQDLPLDNFRAVLATAVLQESRAGKDCYFLTLRSSRKQPKRSVTPKLSESASGSLRF